MKKKSKGREQTDEASMYKVYEETKMMHLKFRYSYLVKEEGHQETHHGIPSPPQGQG